MNPIKLTLPIPVSVNALYANSKKGRHKTQRAKQWESDAMAALIPMFIKDSSIDSEIRDMCNANMAERLKHLYFTTKRKVQKVNVSTLSKAYESLSYSVKYSFAFSQDRSVKPRDIFNFEKQLTDFLVDMGFMLDDVFIDDGRVVRLPSDAQHPHVDIEIMTFSKKGIMQDILETF